MRGKPRIVMEVSKEAIEELVEFRKAHKHDVNVYKRVTCVLLYLRGKEKMEVDEIAQDLGISRNTVTNTVKRYKEGGVHALQDAPGDTKYSKVNDKYLMELKSCVQTSPKELGYGFSRWTLPKLSKHMHKISGIKIAARQLSAILKKTNIRINVLGELYVVNETKKDFNA